MKNLIGIGLTVSVLLVLAAGEAFAQGRGSQRGGPQHGAKGWGEGSQNGYGTQAGALRQQMMQHRFRGGQSGLGNQSGTMQQQRLGDGSGTTSRCQPSCALEELLITSVWHDRRDRKRVARLVMLTSPYVCLLEMAK